MRLNIMPIMVAGLLLAGCATEQQLVQGREDMLAAAGFTVRAADTPARQAEVKTLTPHRFLMQTRDNKTVYLYSDPTVCNCLYIGSGQAYQKYRNMVFQKQIADEQQSAAQMSMDNWNWGPWGPGWW